MVCRINELQNIPLSAAPHVVIRARAELKAYKLLAFQREMKRRLVPLMSSHTSPATALVAGSLKKPIIPQVRTVRTAPPPPPPPVFCVGVVDHVYMRTTYPPASHYPTLPACLPACLPDWLPACAPSLVYCHRRV
jgi:hypothetical protein